MKRLIVCLLILFVAGVLQAAPVYIPDPNLKAAIEAELGVSDPDANDMLELTYLSADSNVISDLTGLETATNLVYLSLSNNLISDLTTLSGLTKLEQLRLRYNDINDIGSLSGLTKLKYLFLSYNPTISDISVLSDMNSLVEVGLSDVNVADISPLADVNQIQVLWLGYNQIEDINALTNYKSLTLLNLRYNPLNFESWCDYLKQIIDNNLSASISVNALLNDRSADINDLRVFASKWLRQDCSWGNGDCKGADFDESGNVDFWDFAVLAEWWMYQP